MKFEREPDIQFVYIPAADKVGIVSAILSGYVIVEKIFMVGYGHYIKLELKNRGCHEKDIA